MTASELAMGQALRREAEYRQAAAESNERRAAAERSLRARQEAARPVMRLAFHDGWWRHASAKQIRDVWQVTAGWAANGDPFAAVAIDRMREELRRRHGASLPPPAERYDITAALDTTPPGEPPSPEAAGFLMVPRGQIEAEVAEDVRRLTGRAPAQHRHRDKHAAPSQAAAGPGTAVPRSRQEAARLAAQILAPYMTGWSAEDVEEALSDLESVSVTFISDDPGAETAADAVATAARGLPLTPGARLRAGRTTSARRGPRAARAPARERTR
jgi:hypothetical protein